MSPGMPCKVIWSIPIENELAKTLRHITLHSVGWGGWMDGSTKQDFDMGDVHFPFETVTQH